MTTLPEEMDLEARMAAPESLLRAFDFETEARYVGLWYGGNKPWITDGRAGHTTSFAPWSTFFEHPFCLLRLAGNNYGADDEEAEYALLIDRITNTIYTGPIELVRRTLNLQWAPATETFTISAEQLQEMGDRLHRLHQLTSRWLQTPAGTAHITRAMERESQALLDLQNELTRQWQAALREDEAQIRKQLGDLAIAFLRLNPPRETRYNPPQRPAWKAYLCPVCQRSYTAPSHQENRQGMSAACSPECLVRIIDEELPFEDDLPAGNILNVPDMLTND